MLLFGLCAAACGSDPTPPPVDVATGTGGAAGGESGAPMNDGGERPSATAGSAGAEPIAPGDLVCKTDDDCTGVDKPVCDQVQGCVACQYDWDCPADHRCRANQCFEKQPCTDNHDC